MEGQRRRDDRFGRRFDIRQHFASRHAQYRQPVSNKCRIAPVVTPGPIAAIMRFTIDLHRHLGAGAVEVENVTKHRVLPTKLNAVRLQSQFLP